MRRHPSHYLSPAPANARQGRTPKPAAAAPSHHSNAPNKPGKQNPRYAALLAEPARRVRKPKGDGGEKSAAKRATGGHRRLYQITSPTWARIVGGACLLARKCHGIMGSGGNNDATRLGYSFKSGGKPFGRPASRLEMPQKERGQHRGRTRQFAYIQRHHASLNGMKLI
jgi:hypothetical protein